MEIGYNWNSDPTMQWSPINTYYPGLYVSYNITWTGAEVNGVSIGGPFGYAIMDSGTTLALLNQNYMNALYNALSNMCSTTNLVGICGLSYSNSIFNPYEPQFYASNDKQQKLQLTQPKKKKKKKSLLPDDSN